MRVKKLSKKSLTGLITLVVVILPTALLILFNSAKTVEAAWVNEDWGYRQKIAITNSGTAQTDFQVSITLDTATLITAGKMQSDCDDIRITDINGKILPYWIETGATGAGGFGCNGSATKIWTKVPTIPTSGATLYVYYGNPQAISAQNGTEVFEMFDDFSGSSLDSSKWTKVNGGTPTFSNGEMTVSASGESKILATGASTADNYIIRARFKTSSSTDTDERVGLAVKASNANPPNGYNYVFHNFVAKNEFAMLNDAICWCQTNTYSWSFDTYYVLDVYHDGTNVKGRIDDGSWYSYATSGRTGYLGLNLGKNNAVSVYDFAFVRKGAATLPTVASPSSEEKAPSPVAYWKFDDGTGTTAQDSTTNNNDGTLTGGPTWQTEDMCVSGKCLKFDGTDDYVDAGDKNLYSSTALSVCSWVRPNLLTASTSFRVVSKGDASNYEWSLYLFGDDPAFVLWQSSGSNYMQAYDSNVNLSLNTWYYICGTTDGTTTKVYMNGIERASTTTTSGTRGTNGTATLQIGRVNATSGEYFNGFIDEPKIYNYARSADQIKADYANRGGLEGASSVIASATNGARGNLSDGLVGYWKMDESSWTNDCTATSVTDSSGNSNNGKACPATTGPTGGASGKFGNAGSFDGSDDYVEVANSTSLQPLTGNWAVGFWMYRLGIGSGDFPQIIGSRPWTTSVDKGWAVAWDSANNKICPHFADGSTGFDVNNVTCSSSTSTLNTWEHWTVVFDRTNSKVNYYKNGVLDGSISVTYPSGSINQTDTVNIAREIGGLNNRRLNARLDETRIYNRALSPAEVTQLYNFAPGPVAYYNFEENTGSTVNDRSGNGNTGTWNGSGSPHWKAGKYGASGNFDGSSDYVSTTLTPSGSAITMEAWVNITAVGNYPMILSYGTNGENNPELRLLAGSGRVEFVRRTDNSGVTDSISVVGTGWNYFVGVADGSNLRLYKNGVLLGTSTVAHTITSTTALKIGQRSNGEGGTFPFTGQIDDVKIYNYARTQDQIISDMQGSSGTATFSLSSSGLTAGSNTKPAAPVGYWRFDEGYGTTANNVGNDGTALNGTLTNMSSPATSTSGWTQAGKVNKALNFDGTNDYVDLPSISSIDSVSTTTNYTFSSWVKTSSTDVYIIRNGNTGGSPTHVPISVRVLVSTGKVRFDIYDGTNNPFVDSISAVNDNQWHFVTAVRNTTNDKLQIYIDGRLETEATDSTTGTMTAAVSADIGRDPTGIKYFNGSIDEPKIYNFALTADQVKMDMNQGAAQVLGALSDKSTYEKQAANQEYCIPGDTATCAAPVGRWDFDEATGTTANDSSGNANTGTLTGGPTWKPGKVNKSLNFDGSDDYVSLGNGSSLNFTGDLTIEMWLKPGSTQLQYADILSKHATGASGYVIEQNSSNTNQYYFAWGNNGWTCDASTLFTLTANVWQYLSITKSGTTVTAYIDGKSAGTCTGSGSTIGTNSDNVMLSRFSSSGGRFWNGQIDQVRIFNYARSASQIAWDYNKGGPVGHWRMDECQGTTANDASGNSNSGTITIGSSGTQTSAGTCTNGASTSAWYNGRTGKKNYSLNFDGTDDYMTTVSATTLGITPATKPFSIALWFKTTATSEVYLFDNYNGTPGDISLRLDTANGVIETLLWDTSGNQNGTPQYGSGYNDNNWHQLIFTWNGAGTEVVYIDGKQIGTTTSASVTGSLESGAAFRIAARPNTTSYFPGQIDDVRIYNYPLTATQVKTLFSEGAYRVGPSTGAP